MPAICLPVYVSLAGCLILAPVPKRKTFFVDLQPKGNQSLTKTFHGGGFADNHLGNLPQGKQKFGGVTFLIGKKLIQLSSKSYRPPPEKVAGLVVKKKCRTLHILHGGGWSAAEGATVARYIVRYTDGTTRTIPIVYGKDVRDWWGIRGQKVSRARVAWKGTNNPAKEAGNQLHLYLTTWTNPTPAKTVQAIDFHSTITGFGPFCVAITVEP